MKDMINWRQLYNESQVIQPDDTNVSIERVSRLVNIYKNDMIERELHRYSQRLSRFSRCCQICTIKSYTTYKWLDTYISGDKNLFDFRLSGRLVSPLVYYWNKILLKQSDKRGQITDFKQINEKDFSISILSNINDNILIKKSFLTNFIPNFISKLIIRYQMYYAYQKAQKSSPSIQVHIQAMKTFRYLFQTNISPIFVCFMNETNNLSELFWIFRHLIIRFNWPLTTKIFSNCSFEKNFFFEQFMMNSLGFIDLSLLNPNQTEYFYYLYRCLKTCHENGPMIFLFNSSKPKSSDYYLMSFLCDVIRFDLSISDVLIIPTCLYKSYLSFSQPFLFKELIDFFIKKFHIEKTFSELIQLNEEKIVWNFIDCLFSHLDYDINQLIPSRIEYSNIIAAIDLCQINSSLTILYKIKNLVKTCSFIQTDNHQWNEIIEEDIQKYLFKYQTIDLKSNLISIIRKEYLFDIISALTILSKIDENSCIFESDLYHQMKFLLFIFNYQIRPCENLQEKIIQHYQLRNYISINSIPQKSMHFRDIILSDHEWSDEEDDINEDFFDYDDDELLINDLSNKISSSIKPFYQINYQENSFQLKFFAQLFASYIEAMMHILKYHLENQLTFFTLEKFHFHQTFSYQETSYLISNDILSFIQRAYLFDTDFEVMYPLSIDKLVLLHDKFVKLFNCLS